MYVYTYALVVTKLVQAVEIVFYWNTVHSSPQDQFEFIMERSHSHLSRNVKILLISLPFNNFECERCLKIRELALSLLSKCYHRQRVVYWTTCWKLITVQLLQTSAITSIITVLSNRSTNDKQIATNWCQWRRQRTVGANHHFVMISLTELDRHVYSMMK